jgi:hypothetical protein
MNFQLFQIILVIAFLSFVLYLYRIKTVSTDRIILFILSLGGILLVIDPNLATQIANFVGIGRGADLIFYLFMIFCLFRFAEIDSNLRSQEQQLTKVVRMQTLQNPRKGSTPTGPEREP